MSGHQSLANSLHDIHSATNLTKSPSFRMSSILEMWSAYQINEQLENEVVRIVLEKVVIMRE